MWLDIKNTHEINSENKSRVWSSIWELKDLTKSKSNLAINSIPCQKYCINGDTNLNGEKLKCGKNIDCKNHPNYFKELEDIYKI